MKDTYFNLPADKGSRLPTVYTENEQNQIIPWSSTYRGINPNYPLFKKKFFSGGAGLSSTAFDYAIFLQCILNGGKYNGKQLIGRRTAELMVSPNFNIARCATKDLSRGVVIMERPIGQTRRRK
jgi:CubicO group peptidase (beta-lactamase class C family)